MSILNIVLLSLIILISLATLVLSIYYDGVEGVFGFILKIFSEFIFTPLIAFFIQAILNFYDCLITGASRHSEELILYYPVTVLLITGLVLSIFTFSLKLSDVIDYVNVKYEEEDEVEEKEKNI